MTGKLITTVFSISLLLLAMSCGSSKHTRKSAMPGTWQATPVTIDGDSKDWPSPYPNYDSKAVIAYATSNDKDNLYITMETGDELTQMKILKSGMTVWIDSGGEKNTGLMGIHYPLPDENNTMEEPSKSELAQGQNNPGQKDFVSKKFESKIKHGIEDATQFTLEGFDSCNGGFMVKQTSNCGIKVRMALDEYKELVWEAAIPFSVLYHKSQVSQQDAGRPISVCYAIKGIKKPASSNDNNNSGGSGMGNTGGMGGGGMGGRGMGGGGGRGGSRGGGKSAQEDAREHLYESTKTWKLFDIAYKQ